MSWYAARALELRALTVRFDIFTEDDAFASRSRDVHFFDHSHTFFGFAIVTKFAR